MLGISLISRVPYSIYRLLKFWFNRRFNWENVVCGDMGRYGVRFGELWASIAARLRSDVRRAVVGCERYFYGVAW